MPKMSDPQETRLFGALYFAADRLLETIHLQNELAMMRFENHQDFVEIELVNQETADLPSRGDAYLSIRVSAAGFTGHNDLWVMAAAFRGFCLSLLELEKNRRGEAVLESISPKELRLVVRSVDSRGHMLIEGATG